MCGRYASTRASELVTRLFRTAGSLPNVAPRQKAMVVRRHPESG
jgi:hypothetical protein